MTLNNYIKFLLICTVNIGNQIFSMSLAFYYSFIFRYLYFTSMSEIELAACGLVCSECDLRNMLNNIEAAERSIAWFKSKGWLEEDDDLSEAIKRKMFCTGCLGDKETHWSPDCGILKCCVEEKNLNSCSFCSDFPCEKLEFRAESNERYIEALERLKPLCEESRN